MSLYYWRLYNMIFVVLGSPSVAINQFPYIDLEAGVLISVNALAPVRVYDVVLTVHSYSFRSVEF